jgi:TPR repeat protein
LVTDFMVGSDANGKPHASAVVVNEGKPGHRRAVGSPAGNFAELQFVQRDTADFVRAGIDWLNQKAAQGDTAAQFSLGNLYATGYCAMTQDHARAIAWWRKAAALGYEDAKKSLEALRANLSGTT